MVLCPHAPWYNEHIERAKQERRQAERRWVKSKLEIDKQILKCKQHVVNDLCKKAKTAYYNYTKLMSVQTTQKLYFGSQIPYSNAKNLTSNNVLPSHTSTKDLANSFGKFFDNKIAKIRCNMNGKKERTIANTCKIPNFGTFSDISESKLCKIISSGNSKFCALDPLPTSLVKVLLPALLPAIHTIVNRSLGESYMPDALKEAIVKPLLKKPSLDKEIYKNYRPVSNLPYIGKVIEHVVIEEIENHLSTYQLHEPLQSAYTHNHSTETALVKVTNDILCALDNRQCVYLVLLDLSAAFDTIDHKVFLRRIMV